MDQVVIDASVFVKLFIDEEYSENAYSLRDSYIVKDLAIFVPSLFQYEVLNALKYSKSFNTSELEKLAEALDNYKFGSFSLIGNFAKVTMDLAVKYNISVYDASYVALAEITNSEFYTADDKLIKAAKLPFIKHIRDFE